MKQMIFYSTTEAELFDRSITERSLADIQATGFDSIYLEFRNCKAQPSSPRFQNWLSYLCQCCNEMQLDIAMDAHPARILTHFEDLYPEAFTDPLRVEKVALSQGTFRLQTSGEPLHWSIEKAFWIEAMSDTCLRQVIDVTAKLQATRLVSEGGGCAMTRQRSRAVTTREFQLDGFPDGTLLIVSRERFLYKARDMGHPALLSALPQVLEVMVNSERPVAGFMWDEPHFGFAFFEGNGRAINDRLFDRFAERFGYRLEDRLVELWWDVEGKKSSLVRYHYAELLEEELAVLEARFQEETRKTSDQIADGKAGFLGMHRTMHEELSDDFFIGSVDYFRHNHFTSSGFTDSVFERDDSMLTFLRMAQSLALDSQDGEAWSNSWGFRPTEAHHAYYLPLMGMMGIRWIAHTYHDSMLFGPGYPHSPLWETLPEHLQDHAALFDACEGARPLADTAVLYNWKVLARYPDASIHTHRRNLLLLTKQLMRQGTSFLFIDDGMLSEASIENHQFRTRIGAFKQLIVPWVDLLDPNSFRQLERMAAEGIDLLLFGAPAELTSDGENVSLRFSDLIGGSVLPSQPLDVGEQIEMGELDLCCAPEQIQSNLQSNPENTYPASLHSYPLTPVKGATLAKRQENCMGLQNGSVRFFGFDLPFFPGAVAASIPGWESPLPDGVIPITSSTNGTEFLGLCGEFGQPMTGKLTWKGNRIQLNGSRFSLYRLDENSLTQII